MALGRGKAKEETQENTTPTTVEDVAGATVADTKKQQIERAIDDIVPEVMSFQDFDRGQLKFAQTFEEFYRMTEETYGEVVDAAQELGDGFSVLTKVQKQTMLVDVPCLLMSWAFRQGDYARPFVSVRVVAKHLNGLGKYIVNDGGVGIAEQLAQYTKDTGKTGGMFARGGFTVSEYDTEDAQGNTIPAATVYINTRTLA